MTVNPGMRIRKTFARPDLDLIAKFSEIPAAVVGDATARLLTMDARIRPMGKGKRILGTALTVHSAPADNFIFHKALSLARKGDVVVVNAGGDMNHSVCGDMMFRYAIARGVAGFVIDGCVRDLAFLQACDFPVYAVGATPRGPYKIPVGEVNMPIACGGQVVCPGDLVIADQDGVTVVRQDDIECVYNKAINTLAKETTMRELIDGGQWDTDSPILCAINADIERLEFEVIE